MPYSNDVLIKEVTGQNILDALEYGVRSLPEPTSRFPQVSGITFKVDVSIDSSVIVDENENFVKVGGERRVYDVKINGKNLDLNKYYTISSNSFILDGGDGYIMFYPCEIIQTATGIDNDLLQTYIKENLNGEIPLKYKSTENRIVKTNGKIYETSDDDDSSGLSGGIIAVIVIVPIVVVAIIIVAIYFLKKRKRIINNDTEIKESKRSENNENNVIIYRNDNNNNIDDKSKE